MITFDSSNSNQNRTASAFGETIFVFVVPSLLHFIGFLSAIYVLRIADNEQLQNLVERVSITFVDLISVIWMKISYSGFYIVSASEPTVPNALVLHCVRNDLVDTNGIMYRFRWKSLIWRCRESQSFQKYLSRLSILDKCKRIQYFLFFFSCNPWAILLLNRSF